MCAYLCFLATEFSWNKHHLLPLKLHAFPLESPEHYSNTPSIPPQLMGSPFCYFCSVAGCNLFDVAGKTGENRPFWLLKDGFPAASRKFGKSITRSGARAPKKLLRFYLGVLLPQRRLGRFDSTVFTTLFFVSPSYWCTGNGTMMSLGDKWERQMMGTFWELGRGKAQS